MNQKIKYSFISYFLALIILSASFYQAYVSVYFIAYQDYIIKELCVQKDNQQGCEGKCYLMKKLNNVITENNTTIPSQNENEFRGNFIFFLSKNSSLNFKMNSDFISNIYQYSFRIKQSLYIDKETPPPKFSI
ncbi:MAG: hypothetical protein HWD85_03630 [Flavobacteriaceae bacterium]|nr:hypothetical protein [Flavobacteriaceae bacterium]